jgi:hypothetical protein
MDLTVAVKNVIELIEAYDVPIKVILGQIKREGTAWLEATGLLNIGNPVVFLLLALGQIRSPCGNRAFS